MSLLHSPKIVNNGLVLCLDAASRKSYPGTGNVWRDLSGNGNDGTLTNGPTFNGANGGSIVFDAIDDHVLGVSNLPISGNASFTISYFAIWDGVNFSNDFPSAVGNNLTGVVNQGLSTTWQAGRIALDFWVNRFRDNTPLTVQTWYHVAFTKIPGTISSTSKLYANGQERSGAVEGTDTTPNITINPFILGRLDATRNFNGRIGNVQIYNRALTIQEIQQNFNATRGRYGI